MSPSLSSRSSLDDFVDARSSLESLGSYSSARTSWDLHDSAISPAGSPSPVNSRFPRRSSAELALEETAEEEESERRFGGGAESSYPSARTVSASPHDADGNGVARTDSPLEPESSAYRNFFTRDRQEGTTTSGRPSQSSLRLIVPNDSGFQFGFDQRHSHSEASLTSTQAEDPDHIPGWSELHPNHPNFDNNLWDSEQRGWSSTPSFRSRLANNIKSVFSGSHISTLYSRASGSVVSAFRNKPSISWARHRGGVASLNSRDPNTSAAQGWTSRLKSFSHFASSRETPASGLWGGRASKRGTRGKESSYTHNRPHGLLSF